MKSAPTSVISTTSAQTRFRITALRVIGLAASAFVLGAAVNLVVPGVLGPAQFADWRLFLLITAFSGLLHFGTLDGLYLRWVGLNGTDVHRDFTAHLPPFLLFQLLIAVLIHVSLANIAVTKDLSGLVAAQVLCFNVQGFGQVYLQATRRFETSAVVGILNPAVTLIALSAFPVVFMHDARALIVLFNVQTATVAVLLAVWAWWQALRRQVRHEPKARPRIDFNLGVGLPVLASGIAYMLIGQLDKITVLIAYSQEQFGLYAFASSIVGVLVTLMTSTHQLLVRHFADFDSDTRAHVYHRVFVMASVLWMAMLALIPVLAKLLPLVLPEFAAATELLFVLMFVAGLGIHVQVLQFGVFKAIGETRQFLWNTLVLLALACPTFAAVATFGALTVIPLASASLYLAWWLLNERHLTRLSVAFTRRSGNRRLLVFSVTASCSILAQLGGFV